MIQRVCSNPECNAVYAVEDDKADDGVCGYACYEKMYCHAPEEVQFEKIEL
jgi:hypothetical protein